MFYTDELELLKNVEKQREQLAWHDNSIVRNSCNVLELQTQLKLLRHQFNNHTHNGNDIVCPELPKDKQ